MRTATSSPSRYQPVRVSTAKECLSPWTLGWGDRDRLLEASPMHQLTEGGLNRVVRQPGSPSRDEEAQSPPLESEAVSLTVIDPERVNGAGVQEDLTGLTVFRFPHGQDLARPVDVARVEGHGFTDPHPRRRQQSDQRLESGCPKRRFQGPGCGHQIEDVIIGVEVGDGPVLAGGEQVGRRDLAAGVEGVEVSSERARYSHPPGQIGGRAGHLGGPSHRQGGRDR